MKYQQETKTIIGFAMKVHRTLGSGFPEVIYQRALEIEFRKNNIPYLREHELKVYYCEEVVGALKPDFFCYGKIVVELKASSGLEDSDFAQALNFVEAFNIEVGLLINFGAESLEFKRLHNNKFKPDVI